MSVFMFIYLVNLNSLFIVNVNMTTEILTVKWLKKTNKKNTLFVSENHKFYGQEKFDDTIKNTDVSKNLTLSNYLSEIVCQVSLT